MKQFKCEQVLILKYYAVTMSHHKGLPLSHKTLLHTFGQTQSWTGMDYLNSGAKAGFKFPFLILTRCPCIQPTQLFAEALVSKINKFKDMRPSL